MAVRYSVRGGAADRDSGRPRAGTRDGVFERTVALEGMGPAQPAEDLLQNVLMVNDQKRKRAGQAPFPYDGQYSGVLDHFIRCGAARRVGQRNNLLPEAPHPGLPTSYGTPSAGDCRTNNS